MFKTALSILLASVTLQTLLPILEASLAKQGQSPITGTSCIKEYFYEYASLQAMKLTQITYTLQAACFKNVFPSRILGTLDADGPPVPRKQGGQRREPLASNPSHNNGLRFSDGAVAGPGLAPVLEWVPARVLQPGVEWPPRFAGRSGPGTGRRGSCRAPSLPRGWCLRYLR